MELKLSFWFVYLSLILYLSPLLVACIVDLQLSQLQNENRLFEDVTRYDDNEVLDEFIDSETDRLIGPENVDACNINLAVDSQLDDLAASVASVAGRGNRAKLYQDNLAKAINLAELGRPIKGRYSEEFNSNGIADALERPKPRVVHSRSLNAKAERELIQYLWYTNKKLNPSEKVLLLSMFNGANLPEHQRQIISEAFHVELLDRLGGDRLKDLVLHKVPVASRIAVGLADSLYLSPSFLEYLPVIGMGITALKRIGKFPYEIINRIRSVKQHVEFIHKMPGHNLKTKLRAAIKTKKGRAMLSAAGLTSLKWLANKLLDRFKHISFGREAVDEIVRRCAYYILMHLAVKLTQCRFGIEEDD